MEAELDACNISDDAKDEIAALKAIYEDEIFITIEQDFATVEIEIVPCEDGEERDEQDLRVLCTLQFQLKADVSLITVRKCKGTSVMQMFSDRIW